MQLNAITYYKLVTIVKAGCGAVAKGRSDRKKSQASKWPRIVYFIILDFEIGPIYDRKKKLGIYGDRVLSSRVNGKVY